MWIHRNSPSIANVCVFYALKGLGGGDHVVRCMHPGVKVTFWEIVLGIEFSPWNPIALLSLRMAESSYRIGYPEHRDPFSYVLRRQPIKNKGSYKNIGSLKWLRLTRLFLAHGYSPMWGLGETTCPFVAALLTRHTVPNLSIIGYALSGGRTTVVSVMLTVSGGRLNNNYVSLYRHRDTDTISAIYTFSHKRRHQFSLIK